MEDVLCYGPDDRERGGQIDCFFKKTNVKIEFNQ
jgi:hypothetical protein